MADFYHSGRPVNPTVVSTPVLNSNKAAASEVWRIKFFTPALVKEVRASVLTAGTGATAGFTVYKNTSSIGKVTVGVIAAGSSADASLDDTVFAAGDALVLKTITSDLNLDAVCFVNFDENHETAD